MARIEELILRRYAGRRASASADYNNSQPGEQFPRIAAKASALDPGSALSDTQT